MAIRIKAQVRWQAASFCVVDVVVDAAAVAPHVILALGKSDKSNVDSKFIHPCFLV